jgi:hypothetical protein
MEDYKKNIKNQGKAADGLSGGAKWVDCLPESKDSWRRVYNQDLKCYEIYVRGGHFLVATGISNEADSYIIGMLPAFVDLVEQILTEIKNGEVTERTYGGVRYILGEHNKAYRKTKRMGKAGLQRRDTSEPDLGGEDS